MFGMTPSIGTFGTLLELRSALTDARIPQYLWSSRQRKGIKREKEGTTPLFSRPLSVDLETGKHDGFMYEGKRSKVLRANE